MYSKNAKFIAKSLSRLEDKDKEAFKLLMGMKAKELKTSEVTYKIK